MEIRDPIHGLIELNELEEKVVNTREFQRLRRIRQLGPTELLYPGATHSRFEHSIGVMFVASRMFDSLFKKKRNREYLSLEENEIEKCRQLVRLAALLHDVGHPPFSHAAETLFRKSKKGESLKHEDYSQAIVTRFFGWINNHKDSREITTEEICSLIGDPVEGETQIHKILRDILTAQVDADRADYLLRDSHHIGVQYGKYDLERLLNTITLVEHPETKDIAIGVEDGGLYVAESLIIARYLMFIQVYLHPIRRVYDFHLLEAMKEILPQGKFPRPSTDEKLNLYLRWDDGKVITKVKETKRDHGRRFLERDHFRLFKKTTDIAEPEERERIRQHAEILGNKNVEYYMDSYGEKPWYNPKREIFVQEENGRVIKELSQLSAIVANMKPISYTRLYIAREKFEEAERILGDSKGGGKY